MIRILREIWLFFWRDLCIARTYRTGFVLEAIEALFGAPCFITLRVSSIRRRFQQALPQGGSYFAFSLVGFVFLDYLNAALDTFESRPGRIAGQRHAGTSPHHADFAPCFRCGIRHLSVCRHQTLRIVIYVAWAACAFLDLYTPRNWLAVSPFCWLALLPKRP